MARLGSGLTPSWALQDLHISNLMFLKIIFHTKSNLHKEGGKDLVIVKKSMLGLQHTDWELQLDMAWNGAEVDFEYWEC